MTPCGKSIALAQMDRIDGGYRFSAGALRIGEYGISLAGVPWKAEFTLTASGQRDLRFELESQKEALVRFIDPQIFEVIGPYPMGFWLYPQFRFGAEVEAAYDEAEQAWRLRGPSGRQSGRV